MRDYYLQNLGIGEIWKERSVAQSASIEPTRVITEHVANKASTSLPISPSLVKSPAASVSELHRQIGECHQCGVCDSNGRANLQAADVADVLLITGLLAPVQLDEQERLVANILAALPLDKSTKVYRTALLKACSRGETVEMLEPLAIESCLTFLQQEIALFRPKLLVVFGDAIWKSLRGTVEVSEELPLPADRFLYHGIPVLVIHSLDVMLEQPILKKQAWRQLGGLKAHTK